MLQTLKDWDRELFVWLNGLGVEQYDTFWVFITKIESWIPLFILFFILIRHYYRWKKGLMVAAFVLTTFLVTLFLTDLTKEFVGRLRPNNAGELADLIRILQTPTSYSFFSGHASSSFAITTFIILSLRQYTKWIYPVILWPLLFVLSRIYVGVHYPSDLFVGAAFGVLMAMLFYKLSRWTMHKFLVASAHSANGESVADR